MAAPPSDPTLTAAWIGVIGGLGGVIVGIGLTIWFENYKESRKAKRLKKALLDELRNNRMFLRQNDMVVKTLTAALGKGESIGMYCAPFMRTVYDNHFAEMVLMLSPEEKCALNMIYSQLKFFDETVERLNNDIREKADAVVVSYAAGLEPLYEKTYTLIGALLDGTLAELLAKNAAKLPGAS